MTKSAITPYPLRLDPELRQKLEVASKKSGRSLQSEIVDRLDRSFFEAPLAGLSVTDVMRVTDHVIKSLYTDYVPRADLEKAQAERNALAHVMDAPTSKRTRKPKD